MTTKDAADLLELIAARAQVLQERGVRRVELGDGVAFTLAAPELAAAPAAPARDDDEVLDPLDDPATFGRPSGDGPRPRRTRTPLMESGE